MIGGDEKLRGSASALLALLIAVSLAALAVAGCQHAEPPGSTHEGDSEFADDEMPSLSPVDLGEGEKLRVVATTSIVADVVRTVGGDLLELTMLLPLGTDPHAFEPTPQDAAAVFDAHVLFANGAGLELFLDPLIASAGEGVPVVPVSHGVELLAFEGDHEHEGRGDDGGSADPHTWFDPNNVRVWTRNIADALSELDPDNADAYEANADAYAAELGELDTWIREQTAQIPEADRELVTDHTGFSYFAHQYGFDQIGAIFPGYSTLAAPSARELAALEEAIEEHDVKAVFVGLTVNPDLAERVAEDTGTKLVFLYTGSLGSPDGPAGNYLSFMRYNVSAIVEALR